jgi:hypothetical protein
MQLLSFSLVFCVLNHKGDALLPCVIGHKVGVPRILLSSNYTLENVRGSPRSVLLTFSQSYVKHDLKKNKILVVSTTGFFRY